jgi:hypothetical protein
MSINIHSAELRLKERKDLKNLRQTIEYWQPQEYIFLFSDEKGEKLYHFSLEDPINVLCSIGYEVVRMEKNEDRLWAKLKRNEDVVFVVTQPDTFPAAIKVLGESSIHEILSLSGYSSYLFYREKGRIRHWKLPEIRLMWSLMEELLNKLYEETPTYVL